MAIQVVNSSGNGPLTDWTAGVGHIYTNTPGDVHEYTFPTDSLPADSMIMAVKVVVSASTTGSGSIRITVRRGTASTDRLYPLPRGSSFTLDGTYTDYEIVLSNLPFPDLMSQDDAWAVDGSNFNDYAFGVEAVSVGSGQISVDEVRLDVVYRPEVTTEALLLEDTVELWQWAEIEGVRWVPTSQHLPENCGDYYYGVDRRPVAGSMLANEMFQGGRVSHARGREEIETARFILLDVDQVAHERDADGGDPPLDLYAQGFYTWLLAYGDRTDVETQRLTDSSGLGYNQEKGLDPKDWGSGYGRRFTVSDTSDWPAADDVDDSYLYIGRETIWYGDKDATSIGDDANSYQLQRGQFGSMNQAHIYNAATGVYPEVSDHPTLWSGRWVKIWFCPIDKATGYPFPRSVALARSYLWGDHQQEVGPGKNQYAVMLAPFEDILKARVPTAPAARIKRLNFWGSLHVVLQEFNAGLPTTNLTQYFINLPASNYKSVKELVSAIDNALNGASTTGSWSIGINGTKVQVSVTYGHWTHLAFSHALSIILGFGDTGRGATVPWIGPDDWDGNANPPNAMHQYTARADFCETFVEDAATKVYVHDAETDDWPSTLGNISGTGDRLCAVMGIDEEEPLISEFGITPTGSDSDGDFLTVMPKQPNACRMFIRDRPRIWNKTGDRPLKTKPMLVADTITPHHFFLRLMTSTGFGHNGSYDVWPLGFGGGIDERLINTTEFVNVGQHFASVGQRRTYFLLDEDSIKSYMDEELQLPSAVFLRQDEEGRFKWQLQQPPTTSDTPPDVVDEHVRKGTAIRQRHGGRANLVNDITLEVDFNPFSEKYTTKLTSREPNSIRHHGVKKKQSKHRGIRTIHTPWTPPTSGSPFSAFYSMCRDIFEQWAWEAPIIALQGTARFLSLLPGDQVAATIARLQDVRDRTGRGISSRGCEILKLGKNLVRGECEVELTYDQLPRKIGGYAPSAEVVSWNAGTKTVTVQANSYSDANAGETDAGFFIPTDKVVVVEYDAAAPAVWHATIDSVSGNTITFTASPGGGDRTPAQYDRIIWEDWGTETTAQQSRGFVHVADANGYVDGANSVHGWNYAT